MGHGLTPVLPRGRPPVRQGVEVTAPTTQGERGHAPRGARARGPSHPGGGREEGGVDTEAKIEPSPEEMEE